MKLETASYNSAGATHAALAEETAFLSYSIEHKFNEPALATIVLADPTGAIAQKYDVDTNSVYVGPGRAKIQDPTGTCIFEGRILKARHDMNAGRVFLLCEDWLSQLDEARVNYDMREDLDGAGLRQSGIKANLEADTTFPGAGDNTSPLYTSGADYYMFDDAMSWDIDEFDGQYMVLPLDHIGEQTITIGPFAEDLLGASSRTGDLRNMWEHDDDVCVYTCVAGVAGSEGEFRLFANEGSLGAEATAITCTMIYQYYNGSGDGVFYYWDATGAGARVPVDAVVMGADANAPYLSLSVTLTPDQVAKAQVDNDGLIKFEFWTAAAGGETPIININQWNITATVLVTTGTSSAIVIEDTRKTGDVAFDDARMYEDGVGYTDETADINDKVGAHDVTFFPDPLSRQDAFYFGSDNQFNEIKIALSIAGDHAGTFIWQYWDGDSWESLSDVVDGTSGFEAAAGHKTVSWTLPSDWATCTVDAQTHYFVRAWQATVAPAVVVQAKGEYGYVVNGAGNILEVDTDLSMTGLGLWETCKYSIAKKIKDHINTIVVASDPLFTLDTSIEATDGITTRHYEERTPLEILKDLTEIDKTVFWIALADHTTPTVIWKRTFAGGVTEMTDASVLAWASGEYDYIPMRNEFHVYGIRIVDNQLFINTKDIAGGDPGATSKTKYGVTRSDVIRNTGAISKYEVTQLGSAMVTRDADVHLYLRATIAGLSAMRLGEEINLNSTFLGLTNEKYVITHWTYNSDTSRTSIRLHPRQSTGFIKHRMYGEHIRHLIDEGKLHNVDKGSPPLTTQTWV